MAMNKELTTKVAAWRALPLAEKIRRRRESVIEHVVGSMAMEGEPVSAEWIRQARMRQLAGG
ncbi:hypothetical protein [Nocardia brasiliensis]|uniref:hypothetical protein n=1 Tax=Nocardia brasiliensis TaxID=37326 RepID=UPI00030AFA6E|nr:hypothetical protein [Nocardia brasiliensis]